MIDYEFGADACCGLREQFGRPSQWPKGMDLALRLLIAVGHQLGRDKTVNLLRHARNACEREATMSRSPGMSVLLQLSVRRPELDDLDDDLYLIWPTLLAIYETLGAKVWPGFVDASLSGLDESAQLTVQGVG